MFDHVVIVPVEMSNDDLVVVLELAKRMKMARNEVIRMLIRLGFEKMMEGGGSEKEEKKRGGVKK